MASKYRNLEDSTHSIKPLGVLVINGNLDMALKRFKTMIKDSKLIIEYKERQEYKKPSVVRREKRMKSLYKKRMLTLENN